MNIHSVYKKLVNLVIFGISTSLGIVVTSKVTDGLLILPRIFDLPYDSNPNAFYWLSLIPIMIFIGCFVSLLYISSASDGDYIKAKKIDFREFALSVALGGSIVLGMQSLMLAWGWLTFAINH